MTIVEPVARPRTARARQVKLVTRPRRPFSRRSITSTDVWLAVVLPVCALAAWVVPQRLWRSIAAIIAIATGRIFLPRPPMAPILATGARAFCHVEPDDIVRELKAGHVEHVFQYLRECLPGGWRAAFKLEGLAHLDGAIAAGKGAVLWVGHFAFANLAAKKALHQAGYAVAHLSRPEHGFSSSSFGIRVFNPIKQRVENRYLAKRIVIRRRSEQLAVRGAYSVLTAGGVVSITAGSWRGRHFARIPFLKGSYSLSTIAPALAHATGASLLPLSVVRAEGVLSVIVDQPILVDGANDRRSAVRAAVEEYHDRLQALVRAYPGQWRGWTYLNSWKKTAKA